MIHGSASFRVRPEELETCLEAIRTFVERVRGEPRTRSYVSLQDSDDPTRFLHVFAFEDAEAREAHASSEAVKAFTDVLYPRCVEPVAFAVYSEVARAG